MSSNNGDKNVLLYFLAGVGVGALIGAAAGLLLAPKPGAETRQDLARKYDELKNKVTDWMRERKEKRAAAGVASSDEVGA
ncbi:MAG: hypothetical protein AKCLJLPJ_00192 [Fimbriimonadales bacterium]|nr:MAG: YtxH domain-containing protein [Armatimonadota bacterium]MBV6502149.1 hypothetical protein [Fimbriimonadales bacterium]MCE7898984.1 YtxH domain-containing protein [Armatimonadetes bacterium ATM1]MDL1927439.1 YtxH domain-containing protein [Fimbriimonadia bacterium ATM]MBC6969716.1 YtxH domain-containing protein [Armatimonadota bacterium]